MVVNVGRNGAAILRFMRLAVVLLTKEGAHRVFFGEVADLSSTLTEEELQLAACNLPNPVNLLDELLE